MQCPVSNPEQPDVNCARALRPQTLCRRPKIVGNSPLSAVNVDGDIFSVVVRLDLRACATTKAGPHRGGPGHDLHYTTSYGQLGRLDGGQDLPRAWRLGK